MKGQTRRAFLKTTLAAAATVTIAGTKSSGRVLGANDTIRVGVAGLNGRGSSHVDHFSKKDAGTQVIYLIDPDTRTYDKRVKTVEAKGGNTPQTVQDVRKALDDKDLDVITIATPNHWHALMTIWACQAGKDVYVEKPCSHNVHEGRIAVDTACKYNRIVQHGTQSRSGSWAMMPELVKSGKYGKLLISRGLCYKPGSGHSTRGDIGFQLVGTPPSELDFNLWLGPAPEQPFHANLVHYRWHWFWDFGNGDIGNQGVHEMDRARWAIPGATLPRSAFSLGGRIGFKDQGQTASTQIAVFDYGETQLIFEVRGLKSQAYLGEDVGNILHFEAGTVAGKKTPLFHPKGGGKPEPLPKIDYRRGPGGGDHFNNFLAAVRSRKREDLNADILEGHYSAALCHLANVSYRLGEPVPFTPRTSLGNPDAEEALARMEEHLAKENNLKLTDWKLTVGRKLQVDASSEKIKDDAEANRLLTREYRKPFAVPDRVV
jgi:predicted dehydrogenase